MKMRVFTVMIVLVSAIACAQNLPTAPAGTPAGSPTTTEPGLTPSGASSTIADRVDVGVTAYNNGVALVRDVRKLNIPKGEQMLQFMDVAQQIRPETVSLRSIDAPGSIVVLEQNYEYDLMSPGKLMEKYVGKQVKLVNFSNEIGFQEVDADLLSNNEGPIYKVGDRIYLGHPGNVVLPQIPANLIAKPTLVWTLDSGASNPTVEVSYLTGGLSWTADYVLTLAKDDASMELAGWVTLSNQSGAEYTNAELKLVAGDVNIAPQMQKEMTGRLEVHASFAEAAMPREESFAEYHLYTMPRRTTIKQNQTKQVSLLTAAGVGVNKQYETVSLSDCFQPMIFPPDQPTPKQDVSVSLKFRNAEKEHLGIPLPAGVVRVYKQDNSGAMQFAGEDRIRHTPKDEDVRLTIGKAFDITAERTRTEFNQISADMVESAYKIVVRNHKDADITVSVVERMAGDWTIIEKSQDFTKRDATTAVFAVAIPKDGEATVTYRVQAKR